MIDMPSTKFVEKVTEHHLSALELAKKVGLGDHDTLSTSEDGMPFHQGLCEVLDALPAGTLLRLDFDRVILMDASFGDAALAALALAFSKGEYKERYLVLEGLNRGSVQNLGYAIDGRQKREDKQVRNLVLPVRDQHGVTTIHGKLEEHLNKPLQIVREAGVTTARDIASALEIDVAAASTKLKTLFDLRLLRREELRDESGKQFLYRFFV